MFAIFISSSVGFVTVKKLVQLLIAVTVCGSCTRLQLYLEVFRGNQFRLLFEVTST